MTLATFKANCCGGVSRSIRLVITPCRVSGKASECKSVDPDRQAALAVDQLNQTGVTQGQG